MFISIFSFFLVFKNDFIRCADFTRIAASTTASDDFTNQVTHRTLTSIIRRASKMLCSFFVVEIDEKSSLTWRVLIRFNDDS